MHTSFTALTLLVVLVLPFGATQPINAQVNCSARCTGSNGYYDIICSPGGDSHNYECNPLQGDCWLLLQHTCPHSCYYSSHCLSTCVIQNYCESYEVQDYHRCNCDD
jgi:hypothetical protein